MKISEYTEIKIKNSQGEYEKDDITSIKLVRNGITSWIPINLNNNDYKKYLKLKEAENEKS